MEVPIHLTIMGVSKNRGTPKSSILIGVSIINHPFWGTPIFGNTHIFAPLEYNPCHHRFTRPHGAHPFFDGFVGCFFRAKKGLQKSPRLRKSAMFLLLCFLLGCYPDGNQAETKPKPKHEGRSVKNRVKQRRVFADVIVCFTSAHWHDLNEWQLWRALWFHYHVEHVSISQ